MSNESTGTAGGATPPAGATPGAAGQGQGQGGATPPTGATPDAAQGQGQGQSTSTGHSDGLNDAGRRALQAERDRAEKAERELKALRDASLSDAERQAKRLQELEAERTTWERERQEARVREAVVAGAARLGFSDPTDAYRLLDPTHIEFDADGRPKNTDKLLSDLAAAKPYLAGAGRPAGDIDGGARGGVAGKVGMNDLIRRAAGR